MPAKIPAHIREQQINELLNISFVRWVGEYKNAESEVVCQCSVDGYQWVTKVKGLIYGGNGCPKCAGNVRWTAEERVEQINKLPNISFVRWDAEYKTVNSKAVCLCSVDGFEWSARVDGLLNGGRGCPRCARNRLRTSEERIEQINNIPNISFVRWDGEYAGSKSKAVCRCDIDGNEWSSEVSSLINAGTGCPKCGVRRRSDKRRTPGNECSDKIDAIKNIAFINWAGGAYRGVKSKAVCKCDIDGFEWEASAEFLLRGSGCPQCAKKRRWTPSERVSQINALPNISFVRWNGAYAGNKSKAICRCDIDEFEWECSVTGLLHGGTGCPKCANYGYNSSKRGTLYVLRSECGSMVKIGISNNYKRRHAELKSATPFSWSCIELIHSDDGAFIAKAEKELHNLTEQAQFSEPFDGYTEWRKWDDRIPMWIEEYRARA